MFKNILVPTDGSELSEKAVRSAVSFAKSCDARITAFYAIPEVKVAYYAEGLTINSSVMENMAKAREQDAQKILGFVESLCRDFGVSYSKQTMVSDKPYDAIIKSASENGSDLIFMASHGRSGIGALLLGSETSKVLAHTKIPVLVFRS